MTDTATTVTLDIPANHHARYAEYRREWEEAKQAGQLSAGDFLIADLLLGGRRAEHEAIVYATDTTLENPAAYADLRALAGSAPKAVARRIRRDRTLRRRAADWAAHRTPPSDVDTPADITTLTVTIPPGHSEQIAAHDAVAEHLKRPDDLIWHGWAVMPLMLAPWLVTGAALHLRGWVAAVTVLLGATLLYTGVLASGLTRTRHHLTALEYLFQDTVNTERAVTAIKSVQQARTATAARRASTNAAALPTAA